MFKTPDPEASLGLQFWNVYARWHGRIMARLRPLDISHTQFVILAALLWCHGEGETPSQARVASLTSLDKMTLSKALKALVARELVIKSRDRVDTRRFVLNLSARGKALTMQALHQVEAVDEHFFGVLGAEKQALLLSLLLDCNTDGE